MTDGSTGGTAMVRSFPGDLASLHTSSTQCFFFERTRNPSADSRALWVSDGTVSGTVKLFSDARAVPTLATSDFETPAAVLGERLYFVGFDPIHGAELWVSDGTISGTHLVADINVGVDSAFGRIPFNRVYQQLFPAGNYLWFSADDGMRGYELWRSDGTAAGTQLVDDLMPGANDSHPGDITAFGNGVLFAASTPIGTELCYSEGPFTTRVVRDLDLSSSAQPKSIVPFGNKALFAATTSGLGYELWITDGTAIGTQLVADIQPGSGSSSPSGITVLGTRAVFAATDSAGTELWSTDGTTAGTRRLLDVNPGSASGIYPEITAHQNRGWMLGTRTPTPGVTQTVLVVTDGEAAGTSVIDLPGFDSVRPQMSRPAITGNGIVLFPLSSTTGFQPWISNGTPATTRQLAAVVPWPNGDGYQTTLAQYAGHLYFAGRTPDEGVELWRSDGNASGTQMVIAYGTGSSSASLSRGGVLPDRAFVFTANSVTRSITDPNLPPVDLPMARTWWAEVVGDRLLVMAETTARTSSSLFLTDGTASGTTVVHSGFTRFSSSDRTQLPDGRILFVTGTELWVTDGQAAGTNLVLGTLPSSPSDLVSAGPGAFFQASGNSLWFTDGTATGTQLLAVLASPIVAPTAFAGRLYFAASDGVAGLELWTSDGTAAGTAQLVDIDAGPGSSEPKSFTVVDDRLFFSAERPAEGRELWSTDGTAAGTVLVADLVPGTESSSPTALFSVGTRLVFSAHTPSEGNELWVSDGSAAGTLLLSAAGPGPWGDSVQPIGVLGNRLLVRATHPSAGSELHAIPLSATGAAYSDTYGHGGVGSVGRPSMFALAPPQLGSTNSGAGVRQTPIATAAGLVLSGASARSPLGGECFLYVGSTDVVLATLTDAGGSARITLPIPNAQELLGADVFSQFAIADAGACFAGIINFSNGLRLHLGL
ncbi:MAG: hypothetical protein R3F56_16795 [Planctomycetota bacterium]